MTRSSTRWWVLAAVSLATFMAYLDNNVTNVALPTIERSLHLSVAGLEWVVSSYVLALGSLLLVGGPELAADLIVVHRGSFEVRVS